MNSERTIGLQTEVDYVPWGRDLPEALIAELERRGGTVVHGDELAEDVPSPRRVHLIGRDSAVRGDALAAAVRHGDGTVYIDALPRFDIPGPLVLLTLSSDEDGADALAAVLPIPGAKLLTRNAPAVSSPAALADDIGVYVGELCNPYGAMGAHAPTGVRREVELPDGARLSYVEYGSGPRVVITAQMDFPSEPNYPSMIAEMLPGTRVLEVTLRGFRPSSTTETDLELGWLDRWADDIAELAMILGIAEFSYTGGSHGGGVGWYLADRHPDRLVSYIGVVSGPHDREHDTRSSGVRRSINDAWPDTDAIARHMEEGVFGPLSHAYRAGRRAELIRSAVAGYGDMLPEEARINQGKPWPDATTDTALARRLQRIAVPALLLSGAQDVIISARASMRAAVNVPGAKMVLWQDEGHMTWEEEPRRLVAEIAAFFSEIGA